MPPWKYSCQPILRVAITNLGFSTVILIGAADYVLAGDAGAKRHQRFEELELT